jgi:hypothetical protein
MIGLSHLLVGYVCTFRFAVQFVGKLSHAIMNHAICCAIEENTEQKRPMPRTRIVKINIFTHDKYHEEVTYGNYIHTDIHTKCTSIRT